MIIQDIGKGNGKYFTANVYIGQRLRNIVNQGNMRFEGFKQAPEGWGNIDIAYWSNVP